jgi:hypothetical protein
MPLKPPTGTADVVERAIAEVRGMRSDVMTGTQIKAGTASSSRPRRLASRPDCALCGKPVEDFTEEEGFLDRFMVFTARCHGEKERIRVELEVIKDGRVSFGLAFVPENRLPAPPAPRALAPVPGDSRETPHAFREDEEDDLCHACRGTADDPIHMVGR